MSLTALMSLASPYTLFHRGHKALPCCLHLRSLNTALQPPCLLTPEMWQASTHNYLHCSHAFTALAGAGSLWPWALNWAWVLTRLLVSLCNDSLSPHRKSIPPGISTTLPQLHWIITEGRTRDSLKTSHSQNSLSTKNTFIFLPNADRLLERASLSFPF